LEQVPVFVLVGFVAQTIDASLGMGFGVISASILLAGGVPPPLISAAVNAAKIPTGLAAALSHWRFGNVDRRIALRLAVAGIITGVSGALLLSHLPSPAVVVLVSLFLVLIGGLILARGLTDRTPAVLSFAPPAAIGAAGGLIEGIGGSWGPVVTTGLLGAGHPPRQAVGSSCTAELAVSVAVFATLMVTHSMGIWGGGETSVLGPVAGLILGGLPAAFFGGWIAARTPRRGMTVAVGLLALGIGLWRLWGLV
jgi:uncharacterized membrane protein YfcA